jgi:hypothetical protein
MCRDFPGNARGKSFESMKIQCKTYLPDRNQDKKRINRENVIYYWSSISQPKAQFKVTISDKPVIRDILQGREAFCEINRWVLKKRPVGTDFIG